MKMSHGGSKNNYSDTNNIFFNDFLVQLDTYMVVYSHLVNSFRGMGNNCADINLSEAPERDYSCTPHYMTGRA